MKKKVFFAFVLFAIMSTAQTCGGAPDEIIVEGAATNVPVVPAAPPADAPVVPIVPAACRADVPVEYLTIVHPLGTGPYGWPTTIGEAAAVLSPEANPLKDNW